MEYGNVFRGTDIMKIKYAKIMSELQANVAMISEVVLKAHPGYELTEEDSSILKSGYRNMKDELSQFETQLEKENDNGKLTRDEEDN